MVVDELPAAEPNRLRSVLESLLPAKQQFTLVHVVSYPKKVRKLIFTSKDDKTLDSAVTHYFILAHKNVAVFALELITYEAQDTCTLFVSKADTSGHYEGGRLDIMAITRALITETALTYFSPHKKARICLFAKAEGQYLLLGSVDNPRKHILSDAALVKWWIRCLDGMYNSFEPFAPGKYALAIPGIDDARGVAKYFPASPKLPWTAGDIFWSTDLANQEDDTLAVKRIPRFPDDPKSRFLDALVAEQRAKQVTRRQFWLELQSRQEFRLGKSVGIIGIESKLAKYDRSKHVRTQAVTYKECMRFKEFLISLNFKTLEAAESSTERLLANVPESAKTELSGRKVPTAEPAAVQPEKRVNTLSIGIVRKKRKP